MALIKCSECGKKFSNKAKACPKYDKHGRPLDSRQEGTCEEEPEETKKKDSLM